MIGTLNLPQTAGSLAGKVSIQLEPFREGKGYYGMYDLRTRTIHIVGQANSFGHEWIHALDHELTTQVLNNPQFQGLLSRYTRHNVVPPTAGLPAAYAHLINTLFFDEGKLAAEKLDLQAKALEVNAQGNPTARARAAQDELDKIAAGAGKVSLATESDYHRMARQFGDPKYWATEYELLARSGEAYIAHKMVENGVDPRGVVMPDQAYLNDLDRRLKETYPKAADRVAQILAWDRVFDEIRRAQIFGGPDAAMSLDFGVVDPKGWDRLAVQGGTGLSLMRAMRESANAMRNWRGRLAEVAPIDPNRPISDRNYLRRSILIAQYLTYTRLGYLDELIKASPKESQPILQELRDMVGTARGSGRHIAETFEEEARNRSRVNLHKVTVTLANENLFHMSPLQNDMLRHFLTTGEDTYKAPGSNQPAEVIPGNIRRAGQKLRVLLDREWDRNNRAGLDIKYARSGYLTRIYDYAAVHGDPLGFTKAAQKVHKVMFDQDVGAPGSNPRKLIERWNQLSAEDKALADTHQDQDVRDLPGQVKELRRNLARQRRLERQIEVTNDPTKIADLQDQLDALKDTASVLAENMHDAMGNFIAELGANAWRSRINIGYDTDFDSVGPSGNYLNHRVLPPEADQIMAPYMIRDVKTILGRYFESSARKTAFATRFGASGEYITEVLRRAEEAAFAAGKNFNYGTNFRNVINSITGRTTNTHGREVIALGNAMQSIASLALMPRVWWSSINEPVISGMMHGSPAAAWQSLVNTFDQLMNTASAQERTELVDALGVTASRMSEAVMANRIGAEFADSPRWGQIMHGFYRVTGLPQWTNVVRRASADMNDGMLRKYSRDLLNTDTGDLARARKARALRLFNDVGVPPQYREDFANWMLSRDGMPELDELKNDRMQPIYSLAIRRLVDWSSPDPYKGDRPMLTDHPWLKMLWSWQSFNGAFTRNVLNPMMEEIEHTYGTTKEEAKAAGAGGISARLRGLGTSSLAAAGFLGGVATLLIVTLFGAMAWAYLTKGDEWQRRSKEGTLWPWLRDLTISRSGTNGMADPLVQAETSLKYSSDPSKLIDAGPISFITGNIANMLHAMLDDDPTGTNTRMHNAMHSAYSLVAAPAISASAAMVGAMTGPVGMTFASLAMQKLSSSEMSDRFADMIVGPKGAKLPTSTEDKLGGVPGLEGLGGADVPGLPGLGAPQRGSPLSGQQAIGATPLGLLDDVLPALWKIGRPIAGMLPGWAKVAGAAGLAAEAGLSIWNAGAPFRGQPPPEKKP
jgi:hypothetical protein